MSKHTPGPWFILGETKLCINADKRSVAVASQQSMSDWETAKANAERIVMCVNALDGLSADALVGGWSYKGISSYCKGLEAQRDKLLEALQEITNVAEKIDSAESFPLKTLDMAFDAIAKVKGE